MQLKSTVLLLALVVAPSCSSTNNVLANPVQPDAPNPFADFDRQTSECNDETPTAMSWLGQPLCARKRTGDTLVRYEANLAEAQTKLLASPNDPAIHVWVGRRFTYLGRYSEALNTYNRAISQFPEFAPLYRHRGQIHLILRELPSSIHDLRQAARLFQGKPDEVEQDGIPNSAGIAVSTLQTNTWLHLGLALYLNGQFHEATDTLRRGIAVAPNDDMLSCLSLWLYYSLLQRRENDEAQLVLKPFHQDMRILEYGNYHRLFMAYTSDDPAAELEAWLADPSLSAHDRSVPSYGLSMLRIGQGQRANAYPLLSQIVAYGNWPEFARIAAEADLARRHRMPSSPL